MSLNRDLPYPADSLIDCGQTYHEANSTYISCCVAVRNMQRNVFVLPREKKLGGMTLHTTMFIAEYGYWTHVESPSLRRTSAFPENGAPTDEDVTIVDVYDEVAAKMDAFHVPKWGSKAVQRKYAFELPGIPSEATYLKVVYPFTCMGSDSASPSLYITSNSVVTYFFLRVFRFKLRHCRWV